MGSSPVDRGEPVGFPDGTFLPTFFLQPGGSFLQQSGSTNRGADIRAAAIGVLAGKL
jgi:hypothetical protein